MSKEREKGKGKEAERSSKGDTCLLLSLDLDPKEGQTKGNIM